MHMSLFVVIIIIMTLTYYNYFLNQDHVVLQCFDTVVWVTGKLCHNNFQKCTFGDQHAVSLENGAYLTKKPIVIELRWSCVGPG